MKVETNLKHSLIYGSLLGDMSCNLPPKCVNARIQITHTSKDIDYALWKKEILNGHSTLYKHLGYEEIKVWTECSKEYSYFRKLCYPGGVKTVTKKWLASIDELALAVWFLDDASLDKCGKSVVTPFYRLHTYCFTLKEQLLLISLLRDFKIKSSLMVDPIKGLGYGIRVSSKSTYRINEIILSKIPNHLKILKRKTLWKYI